MSIVKKQTPITLIDNNFENNTLFVKREDLIPYSFGGHKARKALYFFNTIKNDDFDTVVTYGSSSSNHCRVISNLAVNQKLGCFIISPEETFKQTFNSILMGLFNANIIFSKINEVHEKIDELLDKLRFEGKKPFFIPGGGHGDVGSQAYVDCYGEIKDYETENSIHFDYCFHASGTGTTQAGLVCGQLINRDYRNIIGISIARKNPYGENVVLESIESYLKNSKYSIPTGDIKNNTVFLDEFVEDGYGKYSDHINETINEIMCKYGLPLDPTYTGKAFYGMKKYIKSNGIKKKNILFIHTGGTPLFFDYLRELEKTK